MILRSVLRTWRTVLPVGRRTLLRRKCFMNRGTNYSLQSVLFPVGFGKSTPGKLLCCCRGGCVTKLFVWKVGFGLGLSPFSDRSSPAGCGRSERPGPDRCDPIYQMENDYHWACVRWWDFWDKWVRGLIIKRYLRGLQIVLTLFGILVKLWI